MRGNLANKLQGNDMYLGVQSTMSRSIFAVYTDEKLSKKDSFVLQLYRYVCVCSQTRKFLRLPWGKKIAQHVNVDLYSGMYSIYQHVFFVFVLLPQEYLPAYVTPPQPA